MTKIIWVSRHQPVSKQIAELNRIFGEVEVIQDPEPFATADVVVERFKRMGGDEMLIVAPLSVIDQLVKRGIRPLYAEMESLTGEPATFDVEANGRYFNFLRFTRITGIRIDKEELT